MYTISDQFKDYKGTNPKPSDFDKYWKESLELLNNTDPKPIFEKIQYPLNSIEAFDLYFTGTNNAKIHALHVRPKEIKKPSPAVLIFHGYSGSAPCIAFCLKWILMGYSIFALDCRGQGGLSQDTSSVQGQTLTGHIIRGIENKYDLLYRHIYLDTVQLAKIAASQSFVDPLRMAAIGNSQGGALSLICSALYPSIKKIAPGYPFLCDFEKVWSMNCSAAYDEIKKWFEKKDPLHKRHKYFFETLGYVDVQNFTDKIRAQVLMGMSLNDTVCPPISQFAAYNKINSKKDIVFFPDLGHEHPEEWEDILINYLSDL